MKSKITATGSPLDGYGTWIDELLSDELLSVGGNRASRPIIMPRKFVTIEELVEMEYNPDFIKDVVNREAGEPLNHNHQTPKPVTKVDGDILTQ
jgi:hypothetical protein